MKVFLMYKDRDFDITQDLPPNEKDLIQDLELDVLFNAMAGDDEFFFEVVKRAILLSLTDVDTILYRQGILKDCIKNPSIVREIYNIIIETMEKKKKIYFGFFNKYPSSILSSSIEALELFVEMLKKLRNVAEKNFYKFESIGFQRFFKMLQEELSDEYFKEVTNHLKNLKFRNGILISAELGTGNKGINYTLRKSSEEKQIWLKRILTKKEAAYTFRIADRDESGARALSELKDKGINSVANALSQSADHILDFLNMLRTELAFYIGALNLYEQLMDMDEPMCFPLPIEHTEKKHNFKELYDVCLALTMKKKAIGNTVNANNKELIIITGANQGGKSTFLRSIGIAQLMMQSGMFVPADSFSASVSKKIFTHFKREEDKNMDSGKLDEELNRMNNIIDNISSNSLLLFNESFSSTNEREGSEIAKQIVSALIENHIKVFYVTHLYEFAYNFYNKKTKNTLFLRAERKKDGTRTFRIVEGKPLETSFGKDVFDKVFTRENLLIPKSIAESREDFIYSR